MKTVKDLILTKNKFQLKVDLLWLDRRNKRDERDDIKEQIDNYNSIITSLETLIEALLDADIDNLEEI